MLSTSSVLNPFDSVAHVTLLIFLATVCSHHCVSGHLFFDFPAPRSCFYGGYWGTDKDGPWRRSPCDRDPGSATATLLAGASTCLSVHEFVAHPANYDIQLFTKPVGPGDDDDGIFLKEKIEDTAPDGETGYQRFWVDLPQNVTCENTCTIQVRQYAKDFDWYYYACVDINIVADGEADGSLSRDQCVWEPGPSRIRAQILQSIVLGCVFLVDAIMFLGWFVWSARAIKRTEKPENGGDSESPVTSNDEQGKENEETKNSSWWSLFRQATSKAPYRTVLCRILAWVILSSIAMTVALIGLKSCWF